MSHAKRKQPHPPQQQQRQHADDADDPRFDSSSAQLALTALRERKRQRQAKRRGNGAKHFELKAKQSDELAKLRAENERLKRQLSSSAAAATSSTKQTPKTTAKKANTAKKDVVVPTGADDRDGDGDAVLRVESSADVNRLMQTLSTVEDEELDRLGKLLGDDFSGFADDGLDDFLAFVDDPASDRARRLVAGVSHDGKFNDDDDDDDDASDDDDRHSGEHSEQFSGADADLVSDDDQQDVQEVQYDEDEEDGNDNDDDDGDNDNDNDNDNDDNDDDVDDTPAAPPPTTKYVPPHLRNRDDGELDAIRKRMKRTLNTLSTTNIVAVSREVEQVFASNSRNLTTQALEAELRTLCCATDLTPNLAMAFGALLAATSTFVAVEVLSSVVELQAQRLDSSAERREACNIVLLWACLFRLRSLSTATMCSALSELAGRMDELSVELSMLIVRNCGAHLRRDDAASFKAVVEAVSAHRDAAEASTRAKFLIDTIMELKDNRKQRADALEEIANATRKQLQVLLTERKATQPAPLRATWRDLLDAQSKGRWWLVGSAWVGNVADAPGGGGGGGGGAPLGETTARHIASTQFSDELLAMARQQRMNTDLRRAIFCTMMDSEDFVDAHERLSRLGLRAKDQRELVHVLIHCASRERVFNPFYAHLADRFASTDKKAFCSALRFALWDKLRDLGAVSATVNVNQAQLFAALVVGGCLKLSALKVLNWALLDAPTLLFCRHFFRVLLADTPDTLERVFESLGDKAMRVGVVHYLTGDFRLYLHRMLTGDAAAAGDAALAASLNAARKHLKFALDVIANSQIERDDD